MNSSSPILKENHSRVVDARNAELKLLTGTSSRSIDRAAEWATVWITGIFIPRL
ncbi:hypothetical protein [Paenibacillus zanthoxyli]|uniref:hypothetical protein n=1 Tax=Paenibacillus zanthoxyli TaxID=369399 RepID=UPI0012EC46C3|nr:hypothetical protein [Paenibacillus zanthoxyli]